MLLNRFDEIMADIAGGMFRDKEYFKPLVDSISNMKVGQDGDMILLVAASQLHLQQRVNIAINRICPLHLLLVIMSCVGW